MSAETPLPPAVREALADAPSDEPLADRQASELLEQMALLLESSPPSESLEARLLRETSTAPTRYAPFFARLAALFDLDEAAVEQSLQALADERSWKRTGLRGIDRIEIGPGPGLASARTSFVRFAAGAHFPKHRHLGFEQVFVLEGSYTDDDGVLHGPGNLHEMDVETEHEFWVAETEPCIAASVLHVGLRFRQWPEKFFNLFKPR